MYPYYWSNYAWFSGWSWVFWFGMIFLFCASIGTWGYNNRRNRLGAHKEALQILNERYAKGELTREEYTRMKADILDEGPENKQRPHVPLGSGPNILKT